MERFLSMGYTEVEVIPVEADELMQSVKQLPSQELKRFRELFQDYLEQREWELLSGETLERSDLDDDYSDFFQR